MIKFIANSDSPTTSQPSTSNIPTTTEEPYIIDKIDSIIVTNGQNKITAKDVNNILKQIVSYIEYKYSTFNNSIEELTSKTNVTSANVNSKFKQLNKTITETNSNIANIQKKLEFDIEDCYSYASTYIDKYKQYTDNLCNEISASYVSGDNKISEHVQNIYKQVSRINEVNAAQSSTLGSHDKDIVDIKQKLGMK